MIDGQSHEIAILANLSDLLSMNDEQRCIVQPTVLKHVAGRAPVVVTTSHDPTQICTKLPRRASGGNDFPTLDISTAKVELNSKPLWEQPLAASRFAVQVETPSFQVFDSRVRWTSPLKAGGCLL